MDTVSRHRSTIQTHRRILGQKEAQQAPTRKESPTWCCKAAARCKKCAALRCMFNKREYRAAVEHVSICNRIRSSGRHNTISTASDRASWACSSSTHEIQAFVLPSIHPHRLRSSQPHTKVIIPFSHQQPHHHHHVISVPTSSSLSGKTIFLPPSTPSPPLL